MFSRTECLKMCTLILLILLLNKKMFSPSSNVDGRTTHHMNHFPLPPLWKGSVSLLWGVCVGADGCEDVLHFEIKALNCKWVGRSCGRLLWTPGWLLWLKKSVNDSVFVWLSGADGSSTPLLFIQLKTPQLVNGRHGKLPAHMEILHGHRKEWTQTLSMSVNAPWGWVLKLHHHTLMTKTLLTLNTDWSLCCLIFMETNWKVKVKHHNFNLCLVCVSYHSLYGRCGGSSAGRRNHSDSKSILSEPTHHEESNHSSYRHTEKVWITKLRKE